MMSEINQLIKDLHVELREWEAQEKPSKVTKALIKERNRVILSLTNIVLANMQTKQ